MNPQRGLWKASNPKNDNVGWHSQLYVCLCSNTMVNHGWERLILRCFGLDHQKCIEQKRALYYGRLQCKAGCKFWSLAFCPWLLWSWKDEWKWKMTSRTVQGGSDQYLLPSQGKVQGIMTLPKSKALASLDLILTWKKSQNNVLNTRGMHSAHCDTDHLLVCSKIHLSPSKTHHSTTNILPQIDATELHASVQKLLDTFIKASL